MDHGRTSTNPWNGTRILFVIPPYFDFSDYVQGSKTAVLPAFTLPYGILSMNAYLRGACETDVAIDVLDLNIDLRDFIGAGAHGDWNTLMSARVQETCARLQPSLVGISALFNSSFRYLGDVAEDVRKAVPDTRILAGGGLPSAAYDRVLANCPQIDAVCKGEGELPLKELVDASDRDALLDRHPAWITPMGLLKKKVPQLSFVQDLDAIPPLDYDIIDLAQYQSRSIDKRYADMARVEMSIHTSRGCPFSCVFCSNPGLHGRKVRAMSVERVSSDVQRMRDAFGMTVLMIEDDHFFFNVPRAKVVLAALADLDVRVEFPNGVAVYAIDDEVASLFARAGVSSVALAVESGSDHVLKNIIKKPLKKHLIQPAVDNLRRHGVLSHVFIVIGLPEEQAEHRAETLDMLLSSGFDWVHVFCAMPIFGSRLYDICLENGYLVNERDDEYVATKAAIRAPGVDPEDIKTVAYDMNIIVNFLHNHNVASENYSVAESYFANVTKKYPKHLFGRVFLADVLRRSGKPGAEEHETAARTIYETDPFWRDMAHRFRDRSPVLTALFPGDATGALDARRLAALEVAESAHEAASVT